MQWPDENFWHTPPKASGRAGCGAQWELELDPSASQGRKGMPGRGDWVSGIGHRREQGVGAASHGHLGGWAGVAHASQQAGLGTSAPRPPCRLPSDGAAWLQAAQFWMLFLSFFFSCSVPSFERYALKVG